MTSAVVSEEENESKLLGVLKTLEFSIPHLSDPLLQCFDSERMSKVQYAAECSFVF